MKLLERAFEMTGGDDENVRRVVDLLTRPVPVKYPSLDEILRERRVRGAEENEVII